MNKEDAQAREVSAERLEAAMERYAKLEQKVRRFPPRRRFTVVPTVDKWSTDVASLRSEAAPGQGGRRRKHGGRTADPVS